MPVCRAMYKVVMTDYIASLLGQSEAELGVIQATLADVSSIFHTSFFFLFSV